MPPGSKSPAPPSFYNRMAEMAPPNAGAASSPEKSGESSSDIAEIVGKMITVTDKLAKLGKVNGKDVAPFAARIMDVLKELDMVAKGGQPGGAGAAPPSPPPPPSTPGPAPAAGGGAEGSQPVPA